MLIIIQRQRTINRMFTSVPQGAKFFFIIRKFAEVESLAASNSSRISKQTTCMPQFSAFSKIEFISLILSTKKFVVYKNNKISSSILLRAEITAATFSETLEVNLPPSFSMRALRLSFSFSNFVSSTNANPFNGWPFNADVDLDAPVSFDEDGVPLSTDSIFGLEGDILGISRCFSTYLYFFLGNIFQII